MKKFRNFLTITLLSLFCLSDFTSCSDDDPDSGSNLVGLWESTHLYEWVKEDGKLVGTYEYDYDEFRLLFNSDGTYTFWELEYYPTRWEIMSTGKWSRKGNKVNFTSDEGSGYVTLEELSGNSMKVIFHDKYIDEDNISCEEYGEYSFRRINIED